MMKINISQLRKIGNTQSFSFETSAEALGLDNHQEQWAGSILVEVQVINKGTLFEVSGTIKATLNQICSLCLDAMTEILNIPFSENYREANYSEYGESSSSNSEYNAFTGDEIDISDLIRENIVLAEPLKPVCSKNCKGLCPECGANLNIATCNCNRAKTDPRLAVLEKLLSKD